MVARVRMALLSLRCFALASMSFSAGCASHEVQAGVPQLELHVHQEVLANGLQLLIIPNHTAPVVTALVAFRAGSSVENAELNGYSHLFEHMMFQGSAQVPDSQDFRHQLESYGASSNAVTGVDRVAYYFDVPSDGLEGALELFANALKDPALDPERLDKERKVVLAEVDLNEASPDYRPYHAGLYGLFGEYAVHLNPLGSRDVVASVTRSDLWAMHEKYYVANNALLVLSGDVSVEAGRALAHDYFDDWEPAEDPFEESPGEAPRVLEGDQYEVFEADVTDTRIEVWWQGPGVARDAEDALAGELLSTIANQSDSAFRGLVGPGLSYSAQLSTVSTRDAGYVRVRLLVPPGNEDAALSLLWQVLAQLDEPAGVTQAQLELAQQQAFNDYVATATSSSSLPHALGDFFGERPADDYFRYAETLDAVDPRTLQRFVGRYLRDPSKVVVLTSAHDNLRHQGIDTTWLRGRSAP
jgi:zinc protease